MKFDLDNYRRNNPWIIQNMQNSQAMCGRFPSKDAAVQAAQSYRGGVVEVKDEQKIVLVSEVPNL